jgi:hypothetical protein
MGKGVFKEGGLVPILAEIEVVISCSLPNINHKRNYLLQIEAAMARSPAVSVSSKPLTTFRKITCSAHRK